MPPENRIDFLTVFYSVVSYFLFFTISLIMLVLFPVILLFSLIFDRQRVIIAYIIKAIARFFYFINFIQRTNIDLNQLKAPHKGEKRIYVMNHASIYDPILMMALPGPVKSLVKEAYTKIPVIGWIARFSGNVILKDDTSTGGQMDLYLDLVEKLEQGIPLAIFPEGTRSKDSRLGRFYPGTFKIALDTQADLVPVVFDSWNIIRPGQYWIRDNKIHVKVLDTVKYDDFKSMSYKQIAQMMRVKILTGLLELRDQRRERDKNYYRHQEKYQRIDGEMKEKLVELTK